MSDLPAAAAAVAATDATGPTAAATANAANTAATNAATNATANTAAVAATVAAVNARLDYLINSLHAYDDYINPDGRGRRQGVKRLLHRWTQVQQGLQTYTCPIPYPILKAQAKSRQLQDWSTADVSSFVRIPSTDTHHQLKDTHGNILAYRFRIPQTFIGNLVDTAPILPAVSAVPSIRGDMQHRHYYIWKKYTPQPILSSEYKSQLPHSQTCLDANQSLFRRLSDDLRLINPECYVKFRSIQLYLPADMQPLCGAFPGLAIN